MNNHAGNPSEERTRVTDQNKTLSRKDFEDYEFIIAQLAKMAKMTFPEIREHQQKHPEDNLHMLRHSKDNHLMLFTREGAKRFWQIGRRGLKALGSERHKYDLKRVVGELETHFLNRLFDSPSSVNDEQCHEILLQVVAEISEHFTASTHHIPCNLVAHTKPPSFRIGPVEFQQSQAFWNDNGQAVLESLVHESQREPMKQFFTQQMWTASVKVAPCDPIVAAARATEAIQGSLDLFKLFAGSARGSRVGHAYVAGLPRYSPRMYSDPRGFHVTHRWAFGNAILKDDWLQDLAGFPPWLFGAEALFNRLQSWDGLVEPEQRFLDALAWHSEGVPEPNAAARILKFWTAIERAVSLRIRDNVTTRAAILSTEAKDFPEQSERCQRLYSLRSEIIHGTYRGGIEKLASTSRETEKISRSVVTSYGFMAAQLKAKSLLTRNGLEAEFSRLDSIASRHTRKQRASGRA